MDIQLRKWWTEDAEAVQPLANNPKVAANLRDGFPHPYTMADAQAYIASCQKADDQQSYLRAIVADGEVVGSIGVFRGSDVHRRTGELGYWLGEPYWGRGIVTQAVGQVCREVFAATDILRIFAEPFAGNQGSCRVLEKAGFQYEGTLRSNVFKNGKVMDMKLYALVREA